MFMSKTPRHSKVIGARNQTFKRLKPMGTHGKRFIQNRDRKINPRFATSAPTECSRVISLESAAAHVQFAAANE
jgi:hypothetical protein